jgi:putative DNA primase/helicase
MDDVKDNLRYIQGKALTDNEVNRLLALNKRYTHVTVGGKHKVISMKPCPTNGQELYLESLSDFKNYFLTEPSIAEKNVGDAWLAWKGKNFKPDGISFYPNVKECPDTVYNLYQGFAITPKKGPVEPYIQHIRQVLCNGDKRAADYVIGWLAHLVQQPHEKPSVAIVMKSVEGTGKGTFFEPIKQIFGSHSVHVNGAYQLTGRFNSVVANKMVVFGDEVDLTDVRSADKLKGLISEPRVSVEKKGIDPISIPNYARFIFASNHEQVIRAGNRERRYLVLEPSAEYAQDSAYFEHLWSWIDNEGAAYLLYFLLSYDLTGFNARKAPTTQALLDEKLANLSPYQEFMHFELSNEKPFNNAKRILTSDLTYMCSYWCQDNQYQLSNPTVRSGLGKLIKSMGITPKGKHGRGSMYELPDSKDLRAHFAKVLGQSIEDLFYE